jgi:hypothetical protein
VSNPIDENAPEQPRIDPLTAARMTAPPRDYDLSANGRMLTLLDQIRYLNDRIRFNTGNIAEALSAHNKDANIARTAAGAGARIPGTPTRLEAIGPLDLRSPRLRQQFTDQFKEAISKAAEDSPLRNPRSPEYAQLQDQITRKILQEADPEHLKEAISVRRLQDLNLGSRLSPAGILRSVGEALGMGGIGGIHGAGGAAHHRTDPLRAALANRQEAEALARGEVIPRLPSVGMGDRAGEFLGRAAMSGGIAGGAASLALRAFPLAAAALVVPEILRHIGINIPSPTQLPALYRATVQSGQLTGEGFGAGVSARYRAFRIGLNPFDTITSEIANQIVESVRTAGFTGDRARSLYGTVASVYRDLGLNIQTTTQIISDATRVGGESLRQISDELHGFDDAAHNLQMNINQYAESVMQVSGVFRAAGGGAIATRAAQAFVAGAPRILREGGGLQQYQQVYQNAQPFLAAQLGVPVQYLGLPGNLPHTLDAFQRQMEQEIGRMPGDNLQEKAANASRFGILFRGMDVPNIVQLVSQIGRGRGPGNVMRIENIRNLLNRETGRPSRQISALEIRRRGREWALAQGISADDYQRAITESPTHGRTGMTRYFSTREMGATELRDTQRHAIDRLVQQHLINPQQQAELSKLVGNRHDFQQAIQRMESRTTSGGGRSVEINGVTISLSRGASKILRLDVNKEQVRQGTRPSNRTYESESDRTNLDNQTIP